MDNQDLGILGRVRLFEEVDSFFNLCEQSDAMVKLGALQSFARMCYQIGRIDGREEGAALAQDLRGGGGVTSQGSASTPAEPF